MKTLFNPSIRTNYVSAKKSKKSTNCVLTAKEPKILPDTNSLKAHSLSGITFRASYSTETLVKELNAYIDEKKILSNTTLNEAYKNAKHSLERIANWNYYEQLKIAEKAAEQAGERAKNDHIKGHNGWWQFFHGNGSSQYSAAYDNEMERRFYAPNREIQRLIDQKPALLNIVNIGDKSEEYRNARLGDIDKQIEHIKKLINYQGIRDIVNGMFSSTGGVNDVIAGYDRVKDEINTKFVQPMAKFKDDSSVNVPPCVILYGPTGTGKTTFLKGIAYQSKDYATTIDMSEPASSGGFMEILRKKLEEAKTRYTKENKRTILLINDAEKIFAIKEQDAPLLGVTLDDMDRSMLEKYGNNYDLISDFKQLLDVISKKPLDSEKEAATDSRSATTIFITTNYPHLIHPDIITREGKATKISVGVARNKDLRDILQYYFKKMDKTISRCKTFDENSDYEAFIDNLEITSKGKENLKNLVKTGRIQELGIDYLDMPYRQLADAMAPNMTKGAYSNDDIRVICQDAFKDYLEQEPTKGGFKTSFYKMYKSTKRGINPERLKKFNMIDKMIKDDIVDIETLDALLEQRDLGMLSEKQKNVLQYHITRIESELESLLEREIADKLNPEEKLKKKELEELKAKIEEKNTVSTSDGDTWD